MHPNLRFLLAATAALLFCVGFALDFDWRAMLALKLVPVLLALDWLRVAADAGRYRNRIAFGLAWSLLGDALLALPHDLFIAGLVSFLIAHLGYISAYLERSRAWAAPWLGLALAAVVAILLALNHFGTLGPMQLPVGVYALVIGAMLWRAGALAKLDGAGRLALVGALLFVASDALLAWHRFVDAQPLLRYFNILLYWGGQWGIAASAVAHRAPRPARL